MRRRAGDRGASRTTVAATFLLLVLAGIGLIGASPIALSVFGGTTNHWQRLSFIGQTYGAASALLSVLALVGVMVTLVYQARETKLSREEARRQAVSDLLTMAMNDPDLDECWGPVPENEDAKTRKQQLYTNMIISEWEMSFETNALSETRLRVIANEMFHGQVGRIFWRNAREARLSTSDNRVTRRFHEILDEEYHRASAQAPQEVTESAGREETNVTAHPRTSWVAWAGVGAGALVGSAVVSWLHRRGRRER